MAEDDSRKGLDLEIRECSSLGSGEVANLVGRPVDVLSQLVGHRFDRAVAVLVRDREALGRPAVKSLRELADSISAARFHREQNLANHLADSRVTGDRGALCGLQVLKHRMMMRAARAQQQGTTCEALPLV